MRRIDLSATQVIASVLATLTGAVAASYLGVAGTLIGAGVASFAGTTGTAIYRHYLTRTEERLKAAATVIAPLAAARATTVRHPGSGPAGADGHLPAGQQPRPGSRTLVGTAAGAGIMLGEIRMGAGGGQSWLPALPAPGGAAAPGAAEPEPAAPAARARPASGRGVPRFGRAHWRAVIALTAGAFVLTIAGITVTEAVTGKPLEALVWNRPGSGTTVSDVVSGGTGQPRPAAPATRSPSAPPSAPSPSPSPASPSPSPTRSSPSPSRTASPDAPPSLRPSPVPSLLPSP